MSNKKSFALMSKFSWSVSKTVEINDEFSSLTSEERDAFMALISGAVEWLYDDSEQDELLQQWKTHMAFQRAKLIADFDFEYYKHICLARKKNFSDLGCVIHLGRIFTVPSLVERAEVKSEAPDMENEDYDSFDTEDHFT